MSTSTTRVASGIFKKEFGRVLEDARHNPITITRHNRDFVTIFSSQEVQDTQNEILGEYFLEKVENGEISFLEALRMENRILKDVHQAEKEFELGNFVEYNPDFFENIKQQAFQKHI